MRGFAICIFAAIVCVFALYFMGFYDVQEARAKEHERIMQIMKTSAYQQDRLIQLAKWEN